jgi:hypothetical protein
MLRIEKKQDNICFQMIDFFSKKIIHTEDYDKPTVLEIIENLKELLENDS